jgi:glycosyltransferase involved in cell wall biosynthesis
MRIGIYRSYSPLVGGGYHYEMVALNALSEIAQRGGEDYVCITNPGDNIEWLAAQGGLAYRGLPVQTLPGRPAEMQPPEAFLGSQPAPAAQYDPNRFYIDLFAARALRDSGIDLIVQLNSHPFGFSTLKPFVIPIHDLNHRLLPEFPEVGAFGETQLRDYIFTNICRYATFVLVESELGKAHVLEFYGDHIDADRIRVLPYYPPFRRGGMPAAQELERVSARYGLPRRYFFYPAQFWRHKNHELIVRALRLIADEGKESVAVVLCGDYADYFRASNFKQVMALADELGVRDRIAYLGRVPDEDMPALYRLSGGLVMPTFFGPSNIPPLEAWHFGRPVISSDVPGIRDQIGDAGLLVDPRSPRDLAAAMLRLWRDEPLAAELAARGQRRLAGYGWKEFVDRLSEIVAEACSRVREGRTPRYPEVAL